ncbi:MAG: hypothetical protein JXB05_21285 [Myxococcaceae bacterium]|nr:hypothetical protein [Myxococcaceae bacterium]
MSPTGFLARLVAALLCFVLGWAITYGAIKGGRRLWLRLHPVFGPEGLRAVSFFAAALPFLPFLIPEFQKLLVLALKLLLLVPFGFLLRSAASLSAPQASAEAGSFATHLSKAFESISRNYSELLGQYAWDDHQPLLKGAAFLLVWVGIGQLLRIIISQPGEKACPVKGADGRSNFEAFAKKLRSWQPSSALCLLLLVGLYLSLASIVGLARLNGKPAGNGPDISPKQLRKELEGLQLTEEKLANAYPKDILQAVPLQVQILLDLDRAATAQSGAARELQKPAPYATPDPDDADAPAPSESSRRLAQLVRRSREELQGLWSQMLRAVITEQRRTLDSAYTLFEVDSYPMPGYRERADHFIAIRSWYENRSAHLEGQLNDCKGAIHEADQLLSAWAEEVVRTQHAHSALPRDFGAASERASQQCKLSPLPGGIPTRVVSKSRLVLVFLPVSWILESESEPLALIVGMIGFGLLGSVVSSFIRSQKTALRENQSLKFFDILGVILRGVSAAVVVFLGVQSGLSIFGGGGQQQPHLSPYVVLLACLVAAVFSEDAWAIARRRFRSYVGEDRSPGHPPPPGDAKEQA